MMCFMIIGTQVYILLVHWAKQKIVLDIAEILVPGGWTAAERRPGRCSGPFREWSPSFSYLIRLQDSHSVFLYTFGTLLQGTGEFDYAMFKPRPSFTMASTDENVPFSSVNIFFSVDFIHSIHRIISSRHRVTIIRDSKYTHTVFLHTSLLKY